MVCWKRKGSPRSQEPKRRKKQEGKRNVTRLRTCDKLGKAERERERERKSVVVLKKKKKKKEKA